MGDRLRFRRPFSIDPHFRALSILFAPGGNPQKILREGLAHRIGQRQNPSLAESIGALAPDARYLFDDLTDSF